MIGLVVGWLGCTAAETPAPEATGDSDAPEAPTASTGLPPSTGDSGVSPAATLYAVAPALVDPAVIAHNGEHLVGVPPASTRRDALLVFFPGTGAEAGAYRRFLGHAAERGLHVVGLSYDNRVSVNFDVCRQVPVEERCHRDARLEVLLGEPSPYTPPEVDADNAAFSRLRGLLAWLMETRPDEDWDTFVDGDGEIRFDRVTTAGHSQGGGHAAFTARLHEVARAILFDATESAEWTTEPLATPSDRLYGIVHDEEFGALAMQRSWDQLGMPDGSTTLDDPLPDPLTGHRFVIVRDDCQGEGNAKLHNCAVADAFLPPDDVNGAVLAPVWDTLLGI